MHGICKGRPRMSCTMPSQEYTQQRCSYRRKHSQRVCQSSAKDFWTNGRHTMWTLPSRCIQVYNLLEHIPTPTEEDIRKALSMHSWLAALFNILMEATKSAY